MTTHLFPEDYTTALLRTNRFANPSFEETADGITASTGDFAAYQSMLYDPSSPYRLSGQSGLIWALSETPSATSSLSQQLDGQVTAGRWIAACLPVRMYEWTGRAQVKIFPDAPAVGEGTILAAPADEWVYPVATFLMPGTDDQQATAHLYIYGETDDTPPALAEGDTDAWIATVADTEAEALAALEPYFDGDTLVTDQGLRLYEWTGTPHASPSTESVIDAVTPKLVLNYEHEQPNNTTVHEPVSGGSPLIVRRAFPATRRGTFELFAVDREQAEAIARLCNGQRNVYVLSDDTPMDSEFGAVEPFLIAPTGATRVRWNTPYDSWTVNVPYVRLT